MGKEQRHCTVPLLPPSLPGLGLSLPHRQELPRTGTTRWHRTAVGLLCAATRGSGIAQATWLESGRARSEATPAGAPRHAVRVPALDALPARLRPTHRIEDEHGDELGQAVQGHVLEDAERGVEGTPAFPGCRVGALGGPAGRWALRAPPPQRRPQPTSPDDHGHTLDAGHARGEGRDHRGLGLGQRDAHVRRLQGPAVVGAVPAHAHAVPAQRGAWLEPVRRLRSCETTPGLHGPAGTRGAGWSLLPAWCPKRPGARDVAGEQGS